MAEFDIATYRSTWSIFSDAYALFGQASEILKVKAYASVGLLCRATVEAACYLYLTRKKEDATVTIDPPMTLDGWVRKVGLEELQKAIRKTKVLSEEQLSNLSRIGKHGDLIAHLAEKKDRAVMRNFDLDRNSDPNTAQIWLDKGDAVEDMEDTIDILLTLVRSASPSLESALM
jgi:hypothetical protein